MPLIPRTHITFYIKDNLAERLAFNQTNQAIHVNGKDKLRHKVDNKNETPIFLLGKSLIIKSLKSQQLCNTFDLLV